MTTIEDVELLALEGEKESVLADWYDSQTPEKVTWAQGYVFTAPESVDVIGTICRSEHALGVLSKSADAEAIRDAYSDWPLLFLFHRCRQERDCIPTPDEFWDWLLHAGHALWVREMVQLAKTANMTQMETTAALRWRSANAWLAAIREMHVISCLTEYGVAVNYHPLADVLFGIDGWYRSSLLAIYVPNALYERKPQPGGGFPTDYTLIHLPVSRQGYGRVWLVEQSAIEEVAARIRPVVSMGWRVKPRVVSPLPVIPDSPAHRRRKDWE